MLQVQQRLAYNNIASFQSQARPGPHISHLIPTAQQQMAGFGEVANKLMSKSIKHDPTESESSRLPHAHYVGNLGSSRKEKVPIGKKDGAKEQLG